jgi:hypothetical protein
MELRIGAKFQLFRVARLAPRSLHGDQEESESRESQDLLLSLLSEYILQNNGSIHAIKHQTSNIKHGVLVDITYS